VLIFHVDEIVVVLLLLNTKEVIILDMTGFCK